MGSWAEELATAIEASLAVIRELDDVVVCPGA